MTTTDPGLQPQRTALAWRRTGLAIFVNGVVVLRSGVQSTSGLILGLGVLLVLISLGAVGVAAWRAHVLSTADEHVGPPIPLMLTTTLATCVSCVSGLLAVVISSARLP